MVYSRHKRGNHILITSIEHHSVLNSVRFFERMGFEMIFLAVDQNGLVDPESLSRSVRPETLLVSIMYANDEIGTIKPMSCHSAMWKEKRTLFHIDAGDTL